jgi:hypothetical protein
VRLLILGGTRSLGPHVVDAALAGGHDVTVFTRGRLPIPWGYSVHALTGDRDPRIAPGLDALEDGTWDAVVDTSGYVPRIVAASVERLAPRIGLYVFVSSLSVYAHSHRAGLDETAELATLDDPGTEDVIAHYGLPLWLPASEPDSTGFMHINCDTARRSGLRTRPLAQTIADTAAWLAGRDNAGAWKHVLSAEAERRILDAAGAALRRPRQI